MKKTFAILILLGLSYFGFAQKPEKGQKESLLGELSVSACNCVDSIITKNQEKVEITKKISACIDKVTQAYNITSKLMNLDMLTKETKKVKGRKKININVNMNENSDDYIKSYREIEMYMLANCKPLKEKIASNDKVSEKSFSDNEKALEFYSKGLEESKKGNYEKAIELYEKTVIEDPNFAFAWDNLGISYRRTKQYEKSIGAYNKSLEIYERV
jgi:tetratricopeptide (TPR) repeat protein